ncbi:hypothetical protein AAG570_013802 [Ranatra chinensis]|uniref:Uncharacterized protein n=1 Tax=Ranatra chinensis TaxID=642074 RepID=A0ABD0YD85_9HEMI
MAARFKSDRRLRVWLHLLGLTWRTDFGASQLFCYVGCFLLPSASTYLILLRHPTKIQNLSQFSGTAEMFFMSAISAACLAENLSGRAAMAGVLLEIKKSESRFVGGIEYDFSGMTWRAVVALAAMGLSSAAVYSVKSPVEFILHLAVYLYPPVLVLVNILKFSTLVALMRRHLEVLGRQIGPFRVEEVLGRVATLNRSWALLCRAFSVRALVVLALVWVLCVQSASNAIRHLLDHEGHVDSLILEPFCWVLVGAVFLFDIVAPSWSIYTVVSSTKEEKWGA